MPLRAGDSVVFQIQKTADKEVDNECQQLLKEIALPRHTIQSPISWQKTNRSRAVQSVHPILRFVLANECEINRSKGHYYQVVVRCEQQKQQCSRQSPSEENQILILCGHKDGVISGSQIFFLFLSSPGTDHHPVVVHCCPGRLTRQQYI